MQDAWEPWVQHDGRGCPVPPGTLVEVVCEDRFGYRRTEMGRTDGSSYSSWDWSFFPELQKIVRYRRKRPLGMQILRPALEGLDAPAPGRTREKA
jgi:hypothetical protein